MKNILILLIAAAAFFSCAATKKLDSGNLDELARWMEGSFSSAAQSEADSDFRDIRLEMKRVWPDLPGYWFYVEQAVGNYLDKPYRQRMYHVTLQSDHIRSEIYTIPDDDRFIGAWKDTERFTELRLDSLRIREGCAVILRYANGHYSGSTVDKECGSTLYDATYATSIADIYPDKLVSWDRGYNDKDEQVWGAEKGGYIFVKTE
ncbi:MAG: chromophore lyase CpcT/CpeT [Calditrichia bacterium]